MTDLVQAHKSRLTSLEFTKVHTSSNEMIISCGVDHYIKIWNFSAKLCLLAAVNVTHPLPIKWDFKINYNDIYSNKVLLAIRSIQSVVEKYKSTMTFTFA